MCLLEITQVECNKVNFYQWTCRLNQPHHKKRIKAICMFFVQKAKRDVHDFCRLLPQTYLRKQSTCMIKHIISVHSNFIIIDLILQDFEFMLKL